MQYFFLIILFLFSDDATAIAASYSRAREMNKIKPESSLWLILLIQPDIQVMDKVMDTYLPLIPLMVHNTLRP